MPILPTKCLLDRQTKDLVYDTHHDGEVPCYGCPKSRECPESLEGNLEAAAALMGEDLVSLFAEDDGAFKCERCGGAATVQWRTEPVQLRVAGVSEPAKPGKRIWVCQNERKDWVGNFRKCNWSRVRYADRSLA